MISAATRRLYVMSVVIACAISVLGLALLAPVVSTSTDFSIYNSGWNGTSNLAISVYKSGKLVPTMIVSTSGVDMEIVHIDIQSLPLDPNRTALAIIGPSEQFTDAEGDILGDFVRRGGRLLITDDFGTGNTLLDAIGAETRFSGKLMLDLAFEKQPEFSICYDFDPNHIMTSGVRNIMLNFPSTLLISENATVLAQSSVASFLDSNGDHLRQWDEPAGPFPLIAIERLGLGEVLIISDPSIFINGMLDKLDNRILTDNIIVFLSGEREMIYFDESHRSYFDPISIAMAAIREFEDPLKLFAIGLVMLTLLTLMTDLPVRSIRWTWKQIMMLTKIVLRSVTRREKPTGIDIGMTDDELVNTLLSRHPDWKAGIIRKLIAQTKHHGKRRIG